MFTQIGRTNPAAWTVASHPVSSAKNHLARVHTTAVRKTRPTALRTILTGLTFLTLLAHFSGEHAGTCKNGSDTRFLNPIRALMINSA